MIKNDNSPQAKFTDEGKLVVSLSKKLFANDVDGAFQDLMAHMIANDLKVSAKVIEELRSAGLIADIPFRS